MFPPNSFGSILTDPPYGLKFLGESWDHGVPGVPFWREALRVARPGAFLAAFGGTRTFHRLATAIEDAGWELRDTLLWLYGEGFPKGRDIGKALDKKAGAERPLRVKSKKGAGSSSPVGHLDEPSMSRVIEHTDPATPEAQEWDGWNTVLKPSYEPIVLARKPLASGLTVEANILEFGCGALNIDGCRIEGMRKPLRVNTGGDEGLYGFGSRTCEGYSNEGRYPANVVLDVEAGRFLDADTAERPSRYFYCAKASARERGHYNGHKTVKPFRLMQWLVRLVSPPKLPILDPFCGSGSTLMAARVEGIMGIGIDLSSDHITIAHRRVAEVYELIAPSPQDQGEPDLPGQQYLF
jgi:site-specific DNA-methyltransferase (adenine-specific)